MNILEVKFEIVYSSLCIGIAPIDSVPISAVAIDGEHIVL
jgi:hypothetical protein